jgi:hypothetical protein
MSHAVIAWGRFNPPTEEGHGKLVKAVQAHAEKVGGQHYIFPTHTQDKKKNPMTHADKVGAMRSLFPDANVVSHGKVKTVIDAMKHLEKKGHKEVTLVAGSDRVPEYQKLLHTYRSKEFPGIKKVHVVSAGNRDPDAEGAEGMSASKLRGLVASGKKKEFVKHYSDPKLGAHIHDKVKAGMQMESVNPVGIFLLGGPGSGKDYVLKNIFSRFDLTEVQSDQILNGAAAELYEGKQNIVINGALDEEKILIIRSILEGYDFVIDYVHVGVTNKVSRLRNEQREQPLTESKRIEKFLKAEKLAEGYDCFHFNNSINLNESSELEKVFFASQIEKLLERVTGLGLEIKTAPEPKSFFVLREKAFPPVKHDKESGLPKKYVAGLGTSTAKARAAHWKEKDKLSDSDPRAYEPAPGDATAKTKPSKYTKKFHQMYGEASSPAQQAAIAIDMKKRGIKPKNEEVELDEGASDTSLSAKAAKSGISVGTLRKVYNRGVAAWNSGHRPGTTPQQWGHARVNSYITKGKTYHTADKDLHEDSEEVEQIDEFMGLLAAKKPVRKPVDFKKAREFFDKLDKQTRIVPQNQVRTRTVGEEAEPATQKPHLTVDQIAKKHNVDVAEIEKQLKMGQKIEHEHTKDMDVATDIALNHLGEFPDYYTRLAKLEKQAKAGLKEQEESEIVKHERKVEQQRRIRDTRVLHHQNRHQHQIAVGEAVRRLPRSGNITAVMQKRELNDAERAGYERAKIMNNTPKVQEEVDLDTLFEMQLVGTDEYKKHAIAMTPGQGEPVDAFPVKSPNAKPVAVVAKPGKSIVSQYTAEEHTNCGTPNCCGECGTNESIGSGTEPSVRKSFNELRATVKEAVKDNVESEPKLTPKHKKGSTHNPTTYDATLQGIPVAPKFSAFEQTEKVPKQERSWVMKKAFRKVIHGDTAVAAHEEVSLEEAVQYHLDNNISITENVFRPGSDMFFQLIDEAKRLYVEGNYTPVDEYEQELLESDIGEVAEYEGQTVVLDFPIEEGLEECWTGYVQKGMKKKGNKMVPNCVNEEDKTEGKGIGKPWRSNGGGAVYVRTGDGGIKKVNFSQSGMTKKFMDPAATRSFVARHHCLTNKDKTSASYWACRYPRFFSNSGKLWW